MSIVGTLSSILVGWVLINGFFFFAQPGMVFFPISSLDTTPAAWGMTYRDVALESDDGISLHGWFLPRRDSDRVVIFFHGNAGNISHRGESIAAFHRLGLNVFILDYRGYGRSQGTPNEQGLYRDARAAWNWLTDQEGYSPDKTVIFGRSLGGVVAAKLASEVQPGAVILESTLSSARDAARGLFPLLSHITWLRYELNAARYIRQAKAPVLVLHSADDEVVPYQLGRRVFDAAPEPKRFVELSGGHNDGFLVSEPGYSTALAAFLDETDQMRKAQ